MKPLHLPLEGHDLLAVERFKDDTRHMAEFLILSTHCPLGRRGQYIISGNPLSLVRSRRKKQTAWAVSWRGVLPRENTLSLSALILIESTSITTSFSMPPPWTINGSFGISGAAPARSDGSMIPFALRTDIPSLRTRSRMERVITSGWGIGQNNPSGRRFG